jgi:PAS domain S-box-containing protein
LSPMNKEPISAFENFLTSGARLVEPGILRRIKVLNAFGLTFVIFAPFLGLFYFYVGAFPLFYLCIFAGLAGIFLILLLRITKNPALVGNLAVLVLWGTLTAIRWQTGGVGAGGLMLLSWVWNAVLILLAIFTTGYLWGTIWACLVFLETAFAVFLFRTGYHFANLLPATVSPVYSLGAYLLGLLVVLLFAFLFEKESSEALAREEEKARILRDSTSYIENILLRSPVPTFVVDRQHRVVQWNKACQELTGIPPETILGKEVCEELAINDGGSLADKILEDPECVNTQYGDSVLAQTDSGAFSLETTLPCLGEGEKAIMSAAPIVDQDGVVKGAIQTIQSTERPLRKHTSTVSGLEEHLETTYPAYKIDRTGKIREWNRACEQVFGYSASQMVGNNPLSVLSKPYRPNFREAIVRSLQGETVDGKEWKYYNTQGEPVYVLAKVMPEYDASGEILSCMVTHTDITDLKLRLKRLERFAVDSKEKYKKLADEYQLLKKNIARFIRKKEE